MRNRGRLEMIRQCLEQQGRAMTVLEICAELGFSPKEARQVRNLCAQERRLGHMRNGPDKVTHHACGSRSEKTWLFVEPDSQRIVLIKAPDSDKQIRRIIASQPAIVAVWRISA